MQLAFRRPQPAKKHRHWGWVAWVGGAALLLTYMAGRFHMHADLQLDGMPSFGEARFLPAMAGLTTSIVAAGQVDQVYDDVDAIFASRQALIATAQHSVRMETYFMTPGRRAEQLASALIDRAKHGVEVQFMIDAQGTFTMPKSYWDTLKAGGVDVSFYSPFHLSNPRMYNQRTHRKLLLIDGSVAQIGGAGVSDRWDGVLKNERTPPWADVEVRLHGPVVPILEGTFLQHWLHEHGRGDLRAGGLHAVAGGGKPMLVTLGDPTPGDSPIGTLYMAAIAAARHRLLIASPYFLPGKDAVRALLDAKRRKGMEIRILTEGPSNDDALAYQASREANAELVRAGIDIEEYQPAMMHAKVMVADDAWVCTGSANFDPRSLFHNDELNVSLTDPALAKRMEAFFDRGFAQSKRVTEAELSQRSFKDHALGLAGWLYRWQL